MTDNITAINGQDTEPELKPDFMFSLLPSSFIDYI